MTVHLHRITHLAHLHERWIQFIHDRVYKPEGTVLTLGTLKNYPLFTEFIDAGSAVMRLYAHRAQRVNDWATCTRPGIGSEWHDHKSVDWVLVYYPQDQVGDLLIGTREEHTRVSPIEGMCVMFPGTTKHIIEVNTSPTQVRYSLVLMFKEKK